MIFDLLKNTSAYNGLSANFATAFAWLKKADLAALACGRTEIDGTRVYASVQEYAPKPPSEGKFESHRRYADIQLLAHGEELLGAREVEGLTPEGVFDEEKDLAFYKEAVAQGLQLRLRAGAFAIFFPWDAHAPGMRAEATSEVKKIVVKVEM